MNNPTRLFDFPRYQQEHFPLEVMMSSKVGGATAQVNLLTP